MHDKIKKEDKDLQPGLFDTGYAEMFCDGASSGNPGDSGIGVVIKLTEEDAKRPGKDRTYEIAKYIGRATNNVAEYSALLAGLEKARALGIRKIKIFMDSELMARQINGIYRVKNENLKPLWIRVNDLLKDFDYWKVTHVSREMNKEADALARRGVKKKRLEP